MFLVSPLPLTWHDLESRRIPAADEVAAVVRNGLLFCNRDTCTREETERVLTHALLDRFGLWIAGWNWAASEPGGGGPITSWCCGDDSIRGAGETDDEPTVARVVGSILEWIDFIAALSNRFEELQGELEGLKLAETTERAASSLLPWILQQTEATDAWYATFSSTLSWFLQSQGHASEAALQAVHEVASGVFDSWIIPSSDQNEQACADLGKAVGAAPADDDDIDVLAVWERQRKKVHGYELASWEKGPAIADAHREYVQRVDRARCELRADGLLAALDNARAWAQTSAPLMFEDISSWQEHILVESRPAFRTTPARRGHNTYGFDTSVPKRFNRCLKEALDPSEHWSARAARLYLDVCFFHPFEDGNARAARVVLDAVLMREGLTLLSITPLVLLRRSAMDPNAVARLAVLLESLVYRV